MARVVEIEKNGGPEVLEIKNVDTKDPRPDQDLIEQKAIAWENYRVGNFAQDLWNPLKMMNCRTYFWSQRIKFLVRSRIARRSPKWHVWSCRTSGTMCLAFCAHSL